MLHAEALLQKHHDHSEGLWFGDNASKTMPMCYYTDGEGPGQAGAFIDTTDLLCELHEAGYVSLIFWHIRMDGARIVAYRFTSDEAHDAFYWDVLSKGSSLGRGTFKPWSCDPADRFFFNRYVA